MFLNRSNFGSLALAFILVLTFGIAIAWGADHDHDYDTHDHGGAIETGDSLLGQIGHAATHAEFSLNSSDLAGRQRHAHHVVNIIEGAAGPNFDASWGNPGDGHGAVVYAREVLDLVDGERAVWAENVVTYLEWAAAEALIAATRSDFAASTEPIRRALAFISAALGRAEDTGARGGALALQAAASADVTIGITNFAFGDGNPVTVAVGTTVTWVNHDVAPHTVTGGPLDSGMMMHGDTYSYTFSQPGTYAYVCVYHPAMTHTIIVE